MQITFCYLEEGDISYISSKWIKAGINKAPTLFRLYLKEQNEGKRPVILAFIDNDFADYTTIKWESDYQYFKVNNIPEISDLNVLPNFRGKSIGYNLIKKAESEIAKRSKIAGIGFGLYRDYGKAQKLYISMGYIPDGFGVTYHYQEINPGSKVCLSDDLVLWLTKKLID